MTRAHWILAALVLATWIPSYVLFFHRDVARWWQNRRARQAAERKEHAERLAAQARLREDLAARYLTPSSVPDRADGGSA